MSDIKFYNRKSLKSATSFGGPLLAAGLIVIVSVVIAVFGVVSKTREQLRKDKVEFVADANAKQVSPLRRVIQLRLAQDKARLVQFASSRSVMGPGRARTFGDFGLVALVLPGHHGQLGVSWIEKGPLYSKLQNDQVMLTPDQEVALLKSLPFDRIRDGESYWQRLSDSKGRPLWSLTVAVETQPQSKATETSGNPSVSALPEGTDYQSVQAGTGARAYVVGFFGSNPLVTATEDYIGSASTAFVIDSRGYAATHSNKTMIGAFLKDDPAVGPVVKEILTGRSSAGVLPFTTTRGSQTFSAFEQVDRSNLFVVISTPDTVIGTASDGLNRTVFSTAGLAILVGLLLVFVWGANLLPKVKIGSVARPSGTSIDDATPPGPVVGILAATALPGESVANLRRRPEPITPEMRTPLELPDELKVKPVQPTVPSGFAPPVPESSSVDRSRILKNLVMGMEGALKEPVLAALAHVQLATAKVREIKAMSGSSGSGGLSDEVLEHIETLERDLRRAKDTVDEFARLGMDSHPPRDGDRADVWASMKRVLDRARADLAEHGVVLIEKIQPAPMIKGMESSLESIFEEAIVNARRALQGRSDKTIRVELKDLGDALEITIRDNGVGMDREARRQAFDPFFHLFDDPGAKGLGLSKVMSVAQSHGGRADLVSAPGDGTSLVLRFPVQKHEREIFERAQTAASISTVPESTSAPNSEDRAEVVAAKKAHERSLQAGMPQPPKRKLDVNESSGGYSVTVDFSREGAVSLGGKVPLSERSAANLPPPPRPGTMEGPQFNSSALPSTADPDKTQVSLEEGENAGVPENTIPVRIRPVNRG